MITKMDETWGTGPKFRAEEDENSVGHYGLILGPKMVHFCPKAAFLAHFGKMRAFLYFLISEMDKT